MFKMQIEDILEVGNIISFAGPCENKWEYEGRLEDDFGNVYKTYIPLDKTLVWDDNSIMLGVVGKVDKNSLKGLVLRGA